MIEVCAHTYEIYVCVCVCVYIYICKKFLFVVDDPMREKSKYIKMNRAIKRLYFS